MNKLIACLLAFGVMASATVEAIGGLKTKFAMHRTAGVYVTRAPVPDFDEDLVLSLDPDGSCVVNFAILSFDGVSGQIDPDTQAFVFDRGINYGTCTWEVTDVRDDGAVELQWAFIDLARDPNRLIFPDGSCEVGCFVYGIDRAIAKDGMLYANEVVGFYDRNLVPLTTSAFGPSFNRATFSVQKWDIQEAIDTLESVNAVLPEVPELP